jgi:hypothetical protein
MGLPKTGMARGWPLSYGPALTPQNPVESMSLPLRKTMSRNGGTDAGLSAVPEQGVTHMSGVRRISQEAKARGNARDMLTWER